MARAGYVPVKLEGQKCPIAVAAAFSVPHGRHDAERGTHEGAGDAQSSTVMGEPFQGNASAQANRQGIWFKVFDPQFFVEHRGEPIRFSLNDTEFVKTRLKLTVPKMATTKGGRAAVRLPAQEDVLK